MGLSGKYDFKGIKRAGAAGLRAALATSPYSAWILKGGALTDLILEFIANWAANKGLVLLNIGASYVEGELDQHQLDRAMNAAISEIEVKGGRDNLTPEEKKAIDDKVIQAARRFIVIGKRR